MKVIESTAFGFLALEQNPDRRVGASLPKVTISHPILIGLTQCLLIRQITLGLPKRFIFDLINLRRLSALSFLYSSDA